MEFEGAAYLYTLATVTITFAGFSALLLIIRQAAGAGLSRLDRFLTRTTISHLMMVTAGALLPPLLHLYAFPDVLVWKISSITFGVPMLMLLVTFPRRRKAATGGSSPAIVSAVLVWLGSLSIVAMLAAILADAAPKAAIYLSALTLNFFTLVFAFIMALEVVLRQPVADATTADATTR